MPRWLVNFRREADKLRRRILAPPGARELPLEFPEDFPESTRRLWSRVQPYTMTSKERVRALETAVRHVHAHAIPGDLVECGVAAGGSTMAMALVLIELGDTQRRLHLFDTFAGMTAPTEEDVSLLGKSAAPTWQRRRADGVSTWINHPVSEVRANLLTTGYPPERLVFVEGPVEETLPGAAPDAIALLRLDTDWYESTRAEMETLFPRLAPGGILLLDDYNRWMGSRKAVDEYLTRNGVRMLLSRIDDHAVLGVKEPG